MSPGTTSRDGTVRVVSPRTTCATVVDSDRNPRRSRSALRVCQNPSVAFKTITTKIAVASTHSR